jgi:hypothetical protein
MIYRGYDIRKETVQHTGRERYRIFRGNEMIGSKETEELALSYVDRLKKFGDAIREEQPK